ncbi:hypothetical protein niasHS_016129 [Heterodera schachtii]|uniref:Fido domain-containing protein n=1 Tax=Heterodera schachtii TaxID=97005 RepID=A0ABD2HUN9_HETSC
MGGREKWQMGEGDEERKGETAKPGGKMIESGKLEREVRIHPFFDGNGRTARLFMNLILRRGMGREPVTLDEEWRQE